ncbi:hypothetical protein F1559_003920 [Cyanidiococcus yangmingshanensis]|uniref:Uncharacterized protein n=1 Tax=Cyanidiococcus yangmingshanensis TaxID=2690220 RepID=A0A7J7IN38_9RHOD|nr:hypothetical protein F1559_003920 [Cyanidiococcus yangmingshanensis]
MNRQNIHLRNIEPQGFYLRLVDVDRGTMQFVGVHTFAPPFVRPSLPRWRAGRKPGTCSTGARQRTYYIAASKDRGSDSGESSERKPDAERRGETSARDEQARVAGAKLSGAQARRADSAPAGAAAGDSDTGKTSAVPRVTKKDTSAENNASRKADEARLKLVGRLVRAADAVGKPAASLGMRVRSSADEAIDRLLQDKDPQQEGKRRAVGFVKTAADKTWTWWRNQVIPFWIRPRLPDSLASRSDEAIAAGLHALFFFLFFALPGIFHGPSESEQRALSERRQLQSQTSRLERRMREAPTTASSSSQKTQQRTEINAKIDHFGGASINDQPCPDRKATLPLEDTGRKSTAPPVRGMSNVLGQLRETLPMNQREWIVAASYDSLSAEPLIAVEVQPSAFFTASSSDQMTFTLKLLDGARQLGVNAVRLVDGEGNVLATAGGRTVALVGTERRFQTEIQALRKELERAAAETATARSETAASREELAVAKETYAKERAEVERTLQAIKAENERLAEDLKDALRELEQQPEREALLARAERAEAERQKYALSVESLGEQVAEARNAQQKAEKEAVLARAQEKDSALDAQRREFEAQIQALKTEQERAVASARQEANVEIKKLENMLASAEQAKAEAIAKTRSEDGAEIERLTKQLDHATQERDKAFEVARQESAQTIQELQNKLEQASAEQQRQITQLEKQYQERIRNLESQLEKAASARDIAVQEAKAKTEKEYAQLAQAKERELAASRAELAAAKAESEKQLSRLQQENAKHIDALEKQVAAGKKTAEQLQARIQKLEQRLRSRSSSPVEAEPPQVSKNDTPTS